MQNQELFKQMTKDVRRLIKYLCAFIICTLLIGTGIIYYQFVNPKAITNDGIERSDSSTSAGQAIIEADFQVTPFAETEEGKLARFGEMLINETYAHIGPESQKQITGNRLACASCHLNGGTKPFAAPYIGLSGVFPIYIGRENKVESLEERINGCFERSMNGRAIDVNSHEMRGIVTYIKHLSKEISVGTRIQGQGFVEFHPPQRAADPEKGLLVYQKLCVSCHGTDGQGVEGTNGNREGGYIYPPLWGADSYNDGAGMARLLTAARFIKGNMPLGATHDNPMISDEDAYDVAAYINSHSRPEKTGKEHDYPDLSKKPQDCPYPPYQDSVTQEQHQLGPFDFAKL
ncbi:MAG: c-type cytochrome [Sphingobacterium sp.]